MNVALQCGQVGFIALNFESLPDEYAKTLPCLQCGHLPFQSALIKLTDAIPASSVPKVCDYGHGQVRCKKEVQDTEVYSCRYSRLTIAEVVLQCSATHGTLGQAFARKCYREEDQYQGALFQRSIYSKDLSSRKQELR